MPKREYKFRLYSFAEICQMSEEEWKRECARGPKIKNRKREIADLYPLHAAVETASLRKSRTMRGQ